MGSRQPACAARDLEVGRDGRAIVQGVDLVVERGRSISIEGPSGSGKSSLLLTLAGVIPPLRGEVSVAGSLLPPNDPRRRADIRLLSVGLVFQGAELIPELTALENVMLPARLAGASSPDAEERARAIMVALRLGGLTDRPAMTLSGGEAQRVATARAVINHPPLILADEPTGSVEPELRGIIIDQLRIAARLGDSGLVLVTHDRWVASQMDGRYTIRDRRLERAVANS